MKRSTVISLATGVTVAAIGGLFAYQRATRPPVINTAVPSPQKDVDLQRYLGTWYEIARHENRFQKGMDGVKAHYTMREDGRIGITNSGMTGWPRGDWRVSEGRALLADEVEGRDAKLKVSFFGPLYTGDYWILDHGDDYDWSIVGEPSGRYLWVLSRVPQPPTEVAQAMMKRVEELGYDRWALRVTRQA